MRTIHFIDFSSDARHAICGWVPPADYAGTTVYLSSATCPACIAAIQAKIEAIPAPPRPGRHHALYESLVRAPPLGDDAIRLAPGWSDGLFDGFSR